MNTHDGWKQRPNEDLTMVAATAFFISTSRPDERSPDSSKNIAPHGRAELGGAELINGAFPAVPTVTMHVPDDFLVHIKQTFPTMYLTLLGIIQATALGALFLKIDKLFVEHSFGLSQFIVAVGILLFIALIWNQYLIGVLLFRWVPQVLDALIPFVFGACELAAILGLGRSVSMTLLALSIFFALAVAGFENQYAQGHESVNPAVKNLIAQFRLRDNLACIVSSAILLSAAMALYRAQSSELYSILGGLLIIFIAVAHGFREHFHWNIALRAGLEKQLS